MISTLVKNLIDLLDSENIAYCHWKSNAALDRSADGRNDLDLLIDRRDAAKFKQCVFSLGFKHAQAPYGPARIPGIDDFLGYDFEIGRFIHAQAHYCLVLGHDTTKNYRLPVERAFLASRTPDKDYGFPIPSPEWELIIFCFRMILKFSWISAALTSRYQLPPNALNELEYLKKRVSQKTIHQILTEHFPYVEKTLFDQCLHTIEPGSLRIQWGLARYRLRKTLDCASLRGPIHTTALGMWRHFTNAIRLRMGIGAVKRHPMEGGLVIAVMGSSSTETTALITDLKKWLKKAYHVQTIPSEQLNTGFSGSLIKPFKSFCFVMEKISSCTIFQEMSVFRQMRRAKRLSAKGIIVLIDGTMISKSAKHQSSMLNQLRSYYTEKGISPDLAIITGKESSNHSTATSSQQAKVVKENLHSTQPLTSFLEINADTLENAKNFIWGNL